MGTKSNALTNRNRPKRGQMRRRDLEMGDLFTQGSGSKVYEHTGVRTRPPSAGSSRGGTANGKNIVAWQGRVITGKIEAGEDGAVVTTDGDKAVNLVGRVHLELEYF